MYGKLFLTQLSSCFYLFCVNIKLKDALFVVLKREIYRYEEVYDLVACGGDGFCFRRFALFTGKIRKHHTQKK